MKLVFDGFDWDKGNLTKIRKHGFSVSVIESLFHGIIWIGPDIGHSRSEIRFLGIVPYRTRHVVVVFTMREINHKRLVRPISARYLNERERIKYEKEITQIKE